MILSHLQAVTGLLGGQAYSTYSAGSRFIYDFKLSSDKNNYFAFAWSKWKNTGLSGDDTDNDNISAEHAGYHIISGRQGAVSAELMLSMDIHRAVIGLNTERPELHMIYPILFEMNADDIKVTVSYTVSGNENIESADRAELVDRKAETLLFANKELEERMIAVWKKVLMVNELSSMDSFFETGGNSLKLISLIEKINEEFGTEFSVADLYSNPSVRMLTALISPESEGNSPNDSNIIMI